MVIVVIKFSLSRLYRRTVKRGRQPSRKMTSMAERRWLNAPRSMVTPSEIGLNQY
jgi:hypothetical protein